MTGADDVPAEQGARASPYHANCERRLSCLELRPQVMMMVMVMVMMMMMVMVKYVPVDLDTQLRIVMARIIYGCNVDDNGIKHEDEMM